MFFGGHHIAKYRLSDIISSHNEKTRCVFVLGTEIVLGEKNHEK